MTNGDDQSIWGAVAAPELQARLVMLARRVLQAATSDQNFERLDERFAVGVGAEIYHGAFVTLKMLMDGALRGCIGSIQPLQGDLGIAVGELAMSAAMRDPRFPPLTAREEPMVGIDVSILSRPEVVRSPTDLDPRLYGVIVRSGWRRGVLLPDIEGVESIDQQLSIARRKGGIGHGESIVVERFTVLKFGEASLSPGAAP